MDLVSSHLISCGFSGAFGGSVRLFWPQSTTRRVVCPVFTIVRPTTIEGARVGWTRRTEPFWRQNQNITVHGQVRLLRVTLFKVSAIHSLLRKDATSGTAWNLSSLRLIFLSR